MAIKPITIKGQKVLHSRAQEVADFDGDLAQLVTDMYDTMDAAPGVGLAAPQIGIGKRVFVYSLPNEDGVPERGVVINPVLTLGKISQEDPDPEREVEGCLSVPGLGYPLKRASWVHVSGQGLDGGKIEFDATGWFARCMQHETDHLNGKLYVERLTPHYRKQAERDMKNENMGKPDGTWLPGIDPEPFGDDS